MARHLLCAGWVLAWVMGVLVGGAQAATPSEQLLPDTTAGFLAVPNVDELRSKWNATELGQMFDDPVMKPFVEDLNAQLKAKLSKTGIKLGITWEDLDGVYAGEVCLAAVQPHHEKPELRVKQHGLVLLVDVTGKDEAVAKLLKKVNDSQVAKGSKVTTKKLAGQTVTMFELKKKEGALAPDFAYYAVLQNRLIATDNEATIVSVLELIQKPEGASLAKVAAFKAVTEHVAKAAGEVQPQVRWYVNPFRYAEVARAMAGGKKKRGRDILKVLQEEGFSAVQAAAGYVSLGSGENEIVHHSYIYAPKDPKAAAGDKYQLAMRMLNFPNQKTALPPAWVPSHSGTFLSLNWKMRDAFDKYLASLVDRFADEKDLFETVLQGIKDDVNGPQVDLRADLIAHLGERAMVIIDTVEPITTKSERLMLAVELIDPAAVAKTIDKAMEKDPDARKREHKGQVIWEITNEAEAKFAVEEIKIDGPGLSPGDDEVAPADEDEPVGKLPNSAVTVAHGHLIVASHIDFIIRALDDQEKTLDKGEDFTRVGGALDKLGGGNEALRHFVRTEKAYHATYELVRTGKMPQAETVLGKVLNRLAAGDDEEEVVRKQQIDGTKMPEFDAVKKYLGPAGFFVISEDDGWLVTGCLLKK